jgi:sulfite dehydrogenase (quinone) subunit SoeC
MTTSRTKYERLLQDLKSDLRPQREWGEGRGIFLVIGHFVVGVGAGTWLFGLVFGLREALALALALAAAGGAFHLAFLGRPARFLNMVRRVKSSWISRGFVGLSLFLVGAPLYLLFENFIGQAGFLAAGAGMVILMGYMGFVYTASKGIPFWSTPLHPVLYIAYALRGGIAGVLLALAMTGKLPEDARLLLGLWILLTAAVAVLFVIELHGALTGGNAAARSSVHALLAGRLALYFYGGTLAIGLAVPALFVWAGYADRLSLGAMAAIGVASALGDFFMKYSTIRAGVHLPVRLSRA